MTTNYKMIGKLESGLWVSWNTIDSPDYSGASYTAGGTLISETIQVSANYLDISDYDYKMIGKLESGIWVTWASLNAPDYVGTYYTGGGTLLTSTIQISGRTIITTIPFVNTYSLLFDGSSEYVTMGDCLNFNNATFDAFSISVWIKTTDNNGYVITKMTSTPTGYGFLVNSSGKPYFALLAGTSRIDVYGATSINDGIWHHVCLTYDGLQNASGVAIYVDSTPESLTITNNNLGANSTSNTASFNINGRTNGSLLLSANIDEVSIYNKELSLSEVQSIYNNGTPTNIKSLPSATNLLNWWRCGDGDTYPTINDSISDYTFPTIPDLTTNLYHGTATDMEVSDIQFSSPGSQALVLDGLNEYIKMGNVLGFERTDSFSFSCWVKTTSTLKYFLSKRTADPYTGYSLYISSTGNAQITITYDSTIAEIVVNSSIVINNNLWNHIVATYDGSSLASGINFYINGVLDLSPTIVQDDLGSNSILNAAEFNIGGRTNGTSLLNGSVQDVAVWNKELSSSEATEIYNNKIPINLTTVSCAADLAAWWRCGERYSLAANGVPDFSGNGLHGTQVNMEITDVESRTYIGKSMVFDGTNEYVTMGDVFGFERTDSFSISCWIKCAAVDHPLIMKQQGASPFLGYSLWVDSPYIRFDLMNNTTTNALKALAGSTVVTDSCWHHIVATYDGSSDISGAHIYIDGVDQALTTVANTLSATIINAFDFQFAKQGTRTTWWYAGSLDEVSVWNKVLSIGEVTTIYNAGIPTNLTGSSNLAGYWRMGDGVGFSGTMTNMEAEDITTDVP